MSHLLSLIVLSFLASAVQADAVDALLDKMMHARTMKNYEGTLIIRQGDKLQAMSIKHGLNDGVLWESYESLSGEPRQVIRNNNKVTTIFPARKLITVSHNDSASLLHPKLPEKRDVLKKLYHLKLIGHDRVAKKEAQVLALIPKDKYRYGYKYWLDKNTGLLLRCDLINERGKIIEQLMFSELNVLDVSPQSPKLIEQANEYQQVNVDKKNAKKTQEKWQAKHLPEGFVLTRRVVEIDPKSKNRVVHMTYSDSMSSVSIFIEKHMPEEKAFDGLSTMGAVNAFGLHVKNFHVTAMGEVPQATVRMIAESVYFSEQ